MNLWRKWFPPKWKFDRILEIRKSTGSNWLARATIIRDGEERAVQGFFKHNPTKAEVKAMAKQRAKLRNIGGEKHAFNLRQKGLIIATVHGVWTDDDNFEVGEMLVGQVGAQQAQGEF